jgi:hypothetical protein
MLVVIRLRDAPTVDQQPKVRPAVWRVIRATTGACYVTALTENGSLRMTTAIQSIDVVNRTAETESGRTYDLGAGPADDAETLGLLMVRPRIELQGCFEDVSDQLWRDMLQASH